MRQLSKLEIIYDIPSGYQPLIFFAVIREAIFVKLREIKIRLLNSVVVQNVSTERLQIDDCVLQPVKDFIRSVHILLIKILREL